VVIGVNDGLDRDACSLCIYVLLTVGWSVVCRCKGLCLRQGAECISHLHTRDPRKGYVRILPAYNRPLQLQLQ
jgi:hypothetical protein